MVLLWFELQCENGVFSSCSFPFHCLVCVCLLFGVLVLLFANLIAGIVFRIWWIGFKCLRFVVFWFCVLVVA